MYRLAIWIRVKENSDASREYTFTKMLSGAPAYKTNPIHYYSSRKYGYHYHIKLSYEESSTLGESKWLFKSIRHGSSPGFFRDSMPDISLQLKTSGNLPS